MWALIHCPLFHCRPTLLCHFERFYHPQIHTKHPLFLHWWSASVQKLSLRLWATQLGYDLPILPYTQWQVYGKNLWTILFHWFLLKYLLYFIQTPNLARTIVHYTTENQHKRANAAVLIGSYAVSWSCRATQPSHFHCQFGSLFFLLSPFFPLLFLFISCSALTFFSSLFHCRRWFIWRRALKKPTDCWRAATVQPFYRLSELILVM